MMKQRDFKISPSRGLKIQETISNELIGRYRQLLMSQLYSWFDEGDGNVVYRAVTKLLKKGVFTIVPDPKDQGRELIKAAFYSQVLDKEMLAAFWALIFLRNIKANDDVALVTHYPDKGDTCAKISAFFEDSDVEAQILYCKQGFENRDYAAIQFNEPDEEEYLPDRFVIIENEEQIPHIRFSNIVAYLMVEEDGTVSVASDIRKRTDNNKKVKINEASIDAENEE